MSKMSQLHAELSEQACELGYNNLVEALNDGWEVDYEQSRLRKVIDLQEEAHKAWLKERDELFKELIDLGTKMMVDNKDVPIEWAKTIFKTADFIKKGEM